jgi:hypothetical protein
MTISAASGPSAAAPQFDQALCTLMTKHRIQTDLVELEQVSVVADVHSFKSSR